MTPRQKSTDLLATIALVAIFSSFIRPAIAQDDGARAYWKARDGTHVGFRPVLNLGYAGFGQ